MNQKIVNVFGRKAVIIKSERIAYNVKVPIMDRSKLTKLGVYPIIGSRTIRVDAPCFIKDGWALQGFLKNKSESIVQFNSRHENKNV